MYIYNQASKRASPLLVNKRTAPFEGVNSEKKNYMKFDGSSAKFHIFNREAQAKLYIYTYSYIALIEVDAHSFKWGSLPYHIISNLSAVPASPHKSPETTQHEGRTTLEQPKTDPKHHPTEEGGSSSHTEENAKGSNANTIKVIGTSDQPRPEGFPSEYPAIRPGIASDLKFGGCGSYPNLPWVSTTGPGPNGRTISGVTYRFSATHIRIVCACHGSHMSPEEFVQHASEEQTNADSGSGLSSVPGNNPATSAQSWLLLLLVNLG